MIETGQAEDAITRQILSGVKKLLSSKWVGMELRELDGEVGIFLTSIIYANVHNGQANTIQFQVG